MQGHPTIVLQHVRVGGGRLQSKNRVCNPIQRPTEVCGETPRLTVQVGFDDTPNLQLCEPTLTHVACKIQHGHICEACSERGSGMQ